MENSAYAYEESFPMENSAYAYEESFPMENSKEMEKWKTAIANGGFYL
jgi:hypothetical protein